MKKSATLLGIITISTLLAAPLAAADSMIDGTYKTVSDGSESASSCTLIIKSLNAAHKYGDDMFTVESAGTGACNWSAIGVSKSFVITGGMITNGGASAFMKMTFPFGPAGKRIELTAMDLDGTVRNKELFAKQ